MNRTEIIEAVLNAEGLNAGGSPHSWRCSEPDRFPDYCTCARDIAVEILMALDAGEYPVTP